MNRWLNRKNLAIATIIAVFIFLGIAIINHEENGCLLSSSPLCQSMAKIPTTGKEASAIGTNYTKLAQLLTRQQFVLADQETTDKLVWIYDPKSVELGRIDNVNQLPCQDLKTIDKLWTTASGGKYGFTIQTKIYQEIIQKEKNKPPYQDIDKIYQTFAKQVGWKVGKDLQHLEELSFDPGAGKGHLPMTYVTLGVASCCRDFTLKNIFKLCFMCSPWQSAAPGFLPSMLNRIKLCKI